MKINKSTEAIDHFQKSLRIDERLSDDPQRKRKLSITLQSIGECLMKMDKPTEAMDYFQKSLEIDERLSDDPQRDESLSITLHSIGECLIKMNKPTEAIIFKNHLKFIKKYQVISRTTKVCQLLCIASANV